MEFLNFPSVRGNGQLGNVKIRAGKRSGSILSTSKKQICLISARYLIEKKKKKNENENNTQD